MFNKTRNNRGFERLDFKDRYAVDCSIQQSSLATEQALWLGVDDIYPANFDSPYGRMHLNVDQVKRLIEELQYWVDNDKFQDANVSKVTR